MGIPCGGGFGAGAGLVERIGAIECGFGGRIGGTFGPGIAGGVRIGRRVRRNLGKEGVFGIGQHIGDVIGAGGERGFPAGAFGQFGGIGIAGEDIFEQFIEPRGGGAAARAIGVVGIEPGDMRQQQAGIEARALAHRLSPVIDRFGDAIQRAVCQHLFHMLAREHQRRLPPLGKGGIAAAVDIGTLRRKPDGGAGGARIAVPGKVAEEGDLAFGSESIGAIKRNLPPSRLRE